MVIRKEYKVNGRRKEFDFNKLLIFTLFEVLEYWQENKDTEIAPFTRQSIAYISKYLAKKYKIENQLPE
jgi:hypothetical protein